MHESGAANKDRRHTVPHLGWQGLGAVLPRLLYFGFIFEFLSLPTPFGSSKDRKGGRKNPLPHTLRQDASLVLAVSPKKRQASRADPVPRLVGDAEHLP
eukprot:gene974-569_t